MVDKEILKIICCPNCQSDFIEENKKLICKNCSSSFYEKEGILVLISKDLEEKLRYG